MYKITLEVDENVVCMTINYIFNEGIGYGLGAQLVGTDAIHDGAVFKVPNLERGGDDDR